MPLAIRRVQALLNNAKDFRVKGESIVKLGDRLEGLYPSIEYKAEPDLALPSDFTHTRATTAKTRNKIGRLEDIAADTIRHDYNPETGEYLGVLLEASSTNVFLYSEDFSNASWEKRESSISSNVIEAPDGTITADELIENTSNEVHRLRNAINVTQDKTYTMSIFAKANTRTKMQLNVFHASGESDFADFDLANGTIINDNSSVGEARIEPYPNGWYRCSIQVQNDTDTGSTASFYLINDAGASVYTGDGSSSLYIWGAQYEQQHVATSYIKTTSAQVTRAADVTELLASAYDWYRSGTMGLYCEFSLEYVDDTTQRKPLKIGDGTSSNNEFAFIVNSDICASRLRVSSVTQAYAQDPITAKTYNKVCASYNASEHHFAINGVNDTDVDDPAAINFTATKIEIMNSLTCFGHIKHVAVFSNFITQEQAKLITE